MRKQRTITGIQVMDHFRDPKDAKKDTHKSRGQAFSAAKAIEVVRTKCTDRPEVIVTYDEDWFDDEERRVESRTALEATFHPVQYPKEPGKIQDKGPWHGLTQFERACINSQAPDETEHEAFDESTGDEPDWMRLGWHGLREFAKEQGLEIYKKNRGDLERELRAKLAVKA